MYLEEKGRKIHQYTLSTELKRVLINSYVTPIDETKVFSTHSDNFSILLLLQQASAGENLNYEITGQSMKDPWVFAYALAHYKESMFPDKATLNIADITDSALARIFLLTPTEAEELLETLRVEGFLEIHKTLPPYQVLLKKNGEYALQQIYGNY